jgi:ubiquinone/menaquinone biosynthesis C-methylase UbiE
MVFPGFDSPAGTNLTLNFAIMDNTLNDDKFILDVCCGSRMMWFDKSNPHAIYMDIRRDEFVACDGRHIKVDPDILGDFRNMPFSNNTFQLVVFDPPHLNKLGEKSYNAQKYGKLFPTWETDLKQGFDECMRILRPYGVLIFKWNEFQIPVSRIIEIFGTKPLFGHKSGKQSKTHWMCFMKI